MLQLFKIKNKSSGATALQGFGRQSGRRWSAKLVPTFADTGVSRGQHNGSPQPLISVYRTWIATYFIQVAPQLTSRGWVYLIPDPLPLRKSGSAGNRTQDLCICSQKLWPLDHRGSPPTIYSPQKSLHYQLDKREVGPRRRSVHGTKKQLSPPPLKSMPNLHCPACSLITTHTLNFLDMISQMKFHNTWGVFPLSRN
jgi:hypothetical protein